MRSPLALVLLALAALPLSAQTADRRTAGPLGDSRVAVYAELLGPGAFASLNAELAIDRMTSVRAGVAVLPEVFGTDVYVNGLAALHLVPGRTRIRPDFGMGVRIGGAEPDVVYPFMYLGLRNVEVHRKITVGAGLTGIWSEGQIRGPIPSVSVGHRF